MPSVNGYDRKSRAGRAHALYNAMANTGWSLIGFAPVFIYCYQQLRIEKLIAFTVLAFIPIFLPRAWLQKLQLSNERGWYERLGIHHINKWTQNGTLIKRKLARQFGTQPRRIQNRRSIEGLISQTYMFERFHWMLFIIFSSVMIDAFFRGHLVWGWLILITNLVYNVCPNLLQQYLRLRLRGLIKGLKE